MRTKTLWELEEFKDLPQDLFTKTVLYEANGDLERISKQLGFDGIGHFGASIRNVQETLDELAQHGAVDKQEDVYLQSRTVRNEIQLDTMGYWDGMHREEHLSTDQMRGLVEQLKDKAYIFTHDTFSAGDALTEVYEEFKGQLQALNEHAKNVLKKKLPARANTVQDLFVANTNISERIAVKYHSSHILTDSFERADPQMIIFGIPHYTSQEEVYGMNLEKQENLYQATLRDPQASLEHATYKARKTIDEWMRDADEALNHVLN